MRNLKAILSAAGDMKRKLKHLTEEDIALKSIIYINLPKFTLEDTSSFLSIINDLFVGVELNLNDD